LPGGRAEKIYLQSLPFTIGRSDGADLQIESSQVSREHAEISRHRMRYRLRDLHSTNGTFVNGERIEETTLSDGDLVAFADVEFTFACGGEGPARQTVTQVIDAARSPSASRDAAWQLMWSVRRAHEAVTHRGVRPLFQPIVEIATNEVFAWEALASNGSGAGDPRWTPLGEGIECRPVERLRSLFRRMAAESAIGLPQGAALMIALEAGEIASGRRIGSLCQLQSILGEGRSLIVEIPDSAVRSTPEFRGLLTQLREAGIRVAYDGYASGKAQILEREDVSPDFLKLAPSIFRGIHRGGERQRLVRSIVQISHDIDCLVIAAGVDSLVDLEVCRELGCTLAQGELLGPPQSAGLLLQAAGLPAGARSGTKIRP
jgi:EAL domain-containing protein (putative c-di-GMP-specific phosphodiesterase class I)